VNECGIFLPLFNFFLPAFLWLSDARHEFPVLLVISKDLHHFHELAIQCILQFVKTMILVILVSPFNRKVISLDNSEKGDSISCGLSAAISEDFPLRSFSIQR
jgi:hypothetical protein